MSWAALLVCIVLPSLALAQARGFKVEHYEARLEPDLATRTLKARERIDVVGEAPGTSSLEFDAGALEVDAVRLGTAIVPFSKAGTRLSITLPLPLHAGERAQLNLQYHGAPKHGLEFHPELSQFYTVFSTSQWLVCLDDPSVRATLDLTLVAPAGFSATGSGQAVQPAILPDGKLVFRWQQKAPIPSFTYGFAAGIWREFSDESHGVKLRYLSARRSPEELAKLFKDTGDMIAFMGKTAGIPYEGSYEQALVISTIGQEAAGFALLSEAYGERVLTDPVAQSLIAHEIAHQWWGVLITNADWGHFWLNEGMAVFMAGAWIEQKFGAAAYREQVKLWKGRVDKLAVDNADHALVYESWTSPSANDRTVVYIRGAYVLHQLREELGDEVFWRAIRSYSLKSRGRSVTTRDFQEAVQESAKKDLTAFFDRWVYQRAATIGK